MWKNHSSGKAGDQSYSHKKSEPHYEARSSFSFLLLEVLVRRFAERFFSFYIFFNSTRAFSRT